MCPPAHDAAERVVASAPAADGAAASAAAAELAAGTLAVRAGACSAEAVAASGEAAAAPGQPGAAPAATNGCVIEEGLGGGHGPAAGPDGSIPQGVIALPPPASMTPAPNLLDKDMQVRGILQNTNSVPAFGMHHV